MFHLSHGLVDAVVLPYVIRFNSEGSPEAKKIYELTGEKINCPLQEMVLTLNRSFGIPRSLESLLPDPTRFTAGLDLLVKQALADGCTKTNPVIPTAHQMQHLLTDIYNGTWEGKLWN
jgi:alcohol dehydrogenase class IV